MKVDENGEILSGNRGVVSEICEFG